MERRDNTERLFTINTAFVLLLNKYIHIIRRINTLILYSLLTCRKDATEWISYESWNVKLIHYMQCISAHQYSVKLRYNFKLLRRDLTNKRFGKTKCYLLSVIKYHTAFDIFYFWKLAIFSHGGIRCNSLWKLVVVKYIALSTLF